MTGLTRDCSQNWEGRTVIEQVARDLCDMFDDPPTAGIDWGCYPSW